MPSGRPPETISSSSNPLIKRVRRLRLRKHRERERAFLVEGITHVWRALEHGAPVETVIFCPELLTSEKARELVKGFGARGGDVVAVTRDLFEQTTEREHPSGLAAIVSLEERALSDLSVGSSSVFVALDEVGNPGNLGSIIRSADATGGSGVILVGHATDQHHPVAVKASMGAIFTVPVCRVDGFESLFNWCGDNGITTITTSARATESLWEMDYRLPAALVFGSEATGLPTEVKGRGDLSVAIPMEGSVSSLNLAVSVGILLYELKRRES